ncbi:cation:proton antiporter [Ramlibacter sp. MMS24-I3-19]|uniref:cation:proton antiporter n=1 Tax=Ramlibacter sp. MMS24-I3-19 TaxID=3416606 RepID=UPI003CFF45D5
MSLFELVGVLFTVVAVLGYLNHRYIGLPDTIGITATGLVASLLLAWLGRHVPGATAWASALVGRLDLPEVVFHGLLSVLLFAGSLHVDIGDLARQRLPVLVLATVGVVLSTVFVGGATWWVLQALGTPVALVWCLVFGALISPTDPIAVLGILKTAGVPRALEVDIAGESLFNDGTGVVAFLTILGIATGTAEASVPAVALLLAREVAGAIVVGLAIGYVAFFMLRAVDSYPVEILITLALATGGYSLAERLHVSAPLAVVVMGLVIGNHGARSAMSARTRQHLFSFWELLDEVLNLVLFGLLGINLLALADAELGSPLAALALIPVVLAARFASVGLPAIVVRRRLEHRTPHAVKVLTWGGLRGGISVALALSLPQFEGRDTLVMAAYAVVLFSLLVQAPTLGWLLRRLRIARS